MESTDKDQNTSGTGESHTVNTGARQGKVEQGREIQDPANNSSVAPGPSATESSPKDETDKISDYLDSRNFGRKESMLIDRPDADMPVGPFSEYYNMKHKRRGLAVILAYSEFIRGGPSPRDCAFHDSKICEATFKKLHYEVQTHMNLPKRDFLKVLEQVRNSDHRDCDSLVVVFMSHGGLNEKTNREFIWTYDSMVDTSELWINLTPEECPSLAGKPKLFFIQACRGDDTDLGVQLKKPGALRVQTDSIDDATLSEDYAIPLYADLLMMWASYPEPKWRKIHNVGNVSSGSKTAHAERSRSLGRPRWRRRVPKEKISERQMSRPPSLKTKSTATPFCRPARGNRGKVITTMEVTKLEITQGSSRSSSSGDRLRPSGKRSFGAHLSTLSV
ncbi:caspase-7-like isoform X3 [Macrobrachium nipponense]